MKQSIRWKLLGSGVIFGRTAVRVERFILSGSELMKQSTVWRLLGSPVHFGRISARAARFGS